MRSSPGPDRCPPARAHRSTARTLLYAVLHGDRVLALHRRAAQRERHVVHVPALVECVAILEPVK